MEIVTIGGGTGQFHILQALRLLRSQVSVPLHITAIPTTSDSGGSSGFLRLEHNVIAPGDISQCLFGLHPEPELVEPLFGHRFKKGFFKGHTPRNMIVMSYFERFGATQEAMDKMRDVFHLTGTIAPVTFTSTNLHALLGDSSELMSEHEINVADLLSRGSIQKMWLEPTAEPNPAALSAIARTDAIIVCPGTLACSIVPNFLVPGVVSALKASTAKKIYIANLMNRQGHVPADWSVRDYVRYLESYLGWPFFDAVICNTQSLSPEQVTAYQGEKVAVSAVANLHIPGRNLIARPLLMDKPPAPDGADAIAHLRSFVRHDPARVAGALAVALGDAVREPRKHRSILDTVATLSPLTRPHLEA